MKHSGRDEGMNAVETLISRMRDYSSNSESQPLMWLRGYAVYAAHFIVLVYVVSMLITTICMALGTTGFFGPLIFESSAVLKGQVWRIATYGLVNPPSLWFVIDMFMLVAFGRELEKFFGRKVFLIFYAGVYFLPPLLFTAIGAWLPSRIAGESGAFALFVAFATLYPNVMMLFNVLAKWVAVVLVAIYTLIGFSNRDVTGLISLWSTVAFAYAFVRYQRGEFELPRFTVFKRKSASVKRPYGGVATHAQDTAPVSKSISEVDAILDKIAKSGFASLTAKERAKLDHSRDEILRRNQTARK